MKSNLLKKYRKKYSESYLEFEYAIACSYFIVKLEEGALRNILKDDVYLNKWTENRYKELGKIKSETFFLVKSTINTIINDLVVNKKTLCKMIDLVEQEEWHKSEVYFEEGLLHNYRKIRNFLFHNWEIFSSKDKDTFNKLIGDNDQNISRIKNVNDILKTISQSKIFLFLIQFPEMHSLFKENKYLKWIIRNEK